MAVLPLDLFMTIMEAGYGASRRGLDKKLEEVRTRRESFFSEPAKKRNFYNILQKLKNDGLIRRSKEGWIATSLGKEKLRFLKARFGYKAYPVEKEEELTIIIFDIPERYKSKREWLRRALSEMGFKMVQKSVWSGKVGIPKEFLRDLKELDLLDCIDIFRATRFGSLG